MAQLHTPSVVIEHDERVIFVTTAGLFLYLVLLCTCHKLLQKDT